MPPLQYFSGIPLEAFFNENKDKIFKVKKADLKTTGLLTGTLLKCVEFNPDTNSLIFEERFDGDKKYPLNLYFLTSTAKEGEPPELPVELELKLDGGRRRRTKRRQTKRRRTRRHRSYRK